MRKLSWLASALLLCFSLVLLPAQSFGAEPSPTFNEKLTALLTLCNRLESLNVKLKIELSNCRADLTALNAELTEASNQLETVRESLSESERTLTELKAVLTKAESLLSESERAFQTFREAAEGQIRLLEFQRNMAVISGVVLVIVAILVF